MDNRLNELRRKISILRLKMLEMEASIRDQVNHDLDCTDCAFRLMEMRRELTALVREWSLLGGGERLPTIQERLRENYRAVQRPKTPPKQEMEKRRLTARGERGRTARKLRRQTG
jgi:hypothetical protein